MQEFSLLFPGQGAQIPGMGRDVADSSKDAMDIWKKAEAASGLPLRGIYWEGDKEAMADTRALQPALTAMNLSLWQALSKKVRPQACAGHSLGEYSALCAAGVLDLDTTLAAVSLRGALMAGSDPDGKGAMAAIVKLPLEQVEDALVEQLQSEEDPTFSIYSDESVPIKEIVSVMNIAKRNHYKVILAAQPE